MLRSFLTVGVLIFMSACSFLNPANVPDVVSEKTVRPDYRERISHRLFWMAPEQRWHYNCLFLKPLANLDYDEQKLALPGADLLFRAHFEEKRMAYYSAGHLYRQAADQGLALAYVKLGNLLIDGKGTRANPKGGAKMVLQAARLDCAEGQYRYGELLADGKGVTSDVVRAWGWVDLAKEQGYPESAKLLARIERFLGPAQIALAQQQREALRKQLDLFNKGAMGQELVDCITDRNPTPFITRMRACHAMGGTHVGDPINWRENEQKK